MGGFPSCEDASIRGSHRRMASVAQRAACLKLSSRRFYLKEGGGDDAMTMISRHSNIIQIESGLTRLGLSGLVFLLSFGPVGLTHRESRNRSQEYNDMH